MCFSVPLVTGNPVFKDSNLPIDISAGEAESSDYLSSAAKCPHCFKSYSSLDTLKEHIQLCRSERPVTFSCVQCNAAFSTRDQLDKHETLHSPNAQVVSKPAILPEQVIGALKKRLYTDLPCTKWQLFDKQRRLGYPCKEAH